MDKGYYFGQPTYNSRHDRGLSADLRCRKDEHGVGKLTNLAADIRNTKQLLQNLPPKRFPVSLPELPPRSSLARLLGCLADHHIWPWVGQLRPEDRDWRYDDWHTGLSGLRSRSLTQAIGIVLASRVMQTHPDKNMLRKQFLGCHCARWASGMLFCKLLF